MGGVVALPRLHIMSKPREFGRDDSYEGVVTDKSRGMLDGSNMYHFVEIRLTDGESVKVRIGHAALEVDRGRRSDRQATGRRPGQGVALARTPHVGTSSRPRAAA